MSALESIHTDATFRIFASRNIQVNIWADAPTINQMRAFGRFGAAQARRNPGGAALINLIASGTPSFSEEVREATVKLMKEPNMFRLGAAHLVLLAGLAGSAVRAFLGTAILIGRPPTPNKVFGDTESVADWMLPRLAQGAEAWSRAEILQLTEQASARR